MARSVPPTSTPARSPSEEVQIVDQKLDRYMARKYRRGDMSHLVDRPISLRQLRAGFGRGGQQSTDALRPDGVSVFRDHAAGIAGGASLETRAGIRPLQGGGRHAGACGRGVLGNARRVLHLGAPQRQADPVRIPGQHGAARRAAADRRLRRQRDVQRAGRQGTLDIERYARIDVDAAAPRDSCTRTGPRWRPSTTRISCSAASRDFAASTLPSRPAGGSI